MMLALPRLRGSAIRVDAAQPWVIYGARLFWFVVLVALFAQGNGFPALWHWDEPGKVWQVATGRYNFHHPLLLLRLTRAALVVMPGNASLHDVAVVGRWVSAIAAAGAVDLLALLACALGGRLAGILAALLLGTTALLFGLAHYMKEDTLLLFGLAAFLLALMRFDRAPDATRLGLLGGACGLAAASKYIGVVTLPLALGLVWWRCRADWRVAALRCLAMAAAAAAVFAAVDIDALRDWRIFASGLDGELNHVISNHVGLVRPLDSPFYVDALMQLSPPVVLVAYVYWLYRVFRERRTATAATFIVAAFPVVFLVMLQLSPVKTVRYELPVLALVTMGAACGLAALMTRPAERSLRGLAAVAIVAALAFNVADLVGAEAALTQDSRSEMAAWIRANLPSDAVIIEDRIIGITEAGNSATRIAEVPMRIALLNDAAEFGTLVDATAGGATHVLVTDLTFGRLFNDTLRMPDNDPPATIFDIQRRGFYTTLFERGTLLHYIPSRTPIGTAFSPGLWLFRITPEDDADPARPKREPPTTSALQD
jgi:hypothetical protein